MEAIESDDPVNVGALGSARVVPHPNRPPHPIEKPSDELHVNGAVECRERLGGVLKFYYRRAA